MISALKEIDREIEKLQAQRRDIENKQQKEYEKLAKQFVGKCYKTEEYGVFKIVDIPRRYFDAGLRSYYNRKEFVVVFLESHKYPKCPEDFWDFSPCHCDVVSFDATVGAPSHWLEITKEEFNAEFDKCIAHYKEQISV